ncbi:MAG: ribonuclease J [Actinobacteria bacterium]|nr:ribonuclease J [Actinomycetota bacterium]
MILSHSDLNAPPALAANTLRIIALGGLGEIGRNMTCFEINGKILIIDCGVLFPEESQPGVDLILPDFSYLEDRWQDVVGLVLTHGHEDHIGAVPYLLRNRVDIPIYGTKLTLAFLNAKLQEHRISPKLNEVREGDEISIDEFDLEFVAVNHSIPDAVAVAVKTKAGVVLHTGDFKMDQLPLDGRITDLNTFARLGDAGVDLFMVDSTNAEVPGFVSSESDIIPVLDRVFARAPGRIVVASFASHVHRIQQVIDAAVLHNRQIAFIGRSMVRNMNLAKDLGYLNIPNGVLISNDSIEEIPDKRVVLISTGSQGEPMAALSRMASRDHKIAITQNDTVVLASSLIPGNENSVNRVINGLMRLGAQVVHKGNALVHVSGHAASGELLYAYNIVKPKNVLPVHGEPRHLRANANLAIKSGVKPENVVIAEDGVVVDLANGKARIVGAVPCGYVYVDGASVGDISEVSLKDRRILGEEGFISCVVAVDSQTKKVVVGPEIHARGFAEDDSIFDPVIILVRNGLEAALREGMTDQLQLQQLTRRILGKWVNEAHRRRPMIVPVVIEA